MLYSGFLIFQSPLQKIVDSFVHRFSTRGNQKRMDQIQEILEEMRAQMDACMAQFMEVMLTVTRNQEELRVLLETPRGHRNKGNPNFNSVDHGYVRPPPPPSYHSPQAIPGEMYGRYQGSEVDHNDDHFSVHNSEISVLARDMRPIKDLEKEKVEKVEEEMDVTSFPYTPKRIPTPARLVPLVVTLPGPVPYSSEKVVPWHYGSDVYYHGVKQVFILIPSKKEEVEKEDVNAGDFSSFGRITRSGRVFAPPNPQDVANALAKAKGK
ncbi:hypothetical protein KIW84_044288 [Lathyrus oleraceus]|uniref:Uncharacterized protein n=1 Tax=Pisum sativum TaxID=3888 RepID=A0A9D4XHG8_PEA|nr:hypothetical protein KIW84_044288 [Pisum sativum]